MDDFLKDIVDCYNNHFWEETPAKDTKEVIKRLEEKTEE